MALCPRGFVRSLVHDMPLLQERASFAQSFPAQARILCMLSTHLKNDTHCSSRRKMCDTNPSNTVHMKCHRCADEHV
eukprot:2169076-Amphidinium_carterae.1